MLRNVDFSEISDGRRYSSKDLARIACDDCRGCSKCCHEMTDTIILDPYDVYRLSKALSLSFEEMIDEKHKILEISMADGLCLPHIRMEDERHCCPLLSLDGRCSVHEDRPGFCRLFPLGRIYENGGFSYFYQINECPHPNKTKVKIEKWLGYDNLQDYETFVLKWHDYIEKKRLEIKESSFEGTVKDTIMSVLVNFYLRLYSDDRPFFEQIYEYMQ